MTLRVLLPACLLSIFSIQLHALVAPRVVMIKSKVGRFEPGPDVAAALTKFEPQFKLFTPEDFIPSVRALFVDDATNQTPMALTADFNGDGKVDAVVLGSARNERLTLGLVSGPAGYAVLVIDRAALVKPDQSYFPPEVQDATVSDESEAELPRERGLFEYLSLVPNAKRAPRDGAKHFKNDALLLETFRGTDARLFHLDGGSFKEWKP